MPPNKVDCDVHCSLPSVHALYPYLEAHWPAYLESGHYRHIGSKATYPPWSDMFGSDAEEMTLAQLRDAVLTTADTAVLYCYYGLEMMQHPYLAADLATALNRWMLREWLEPDGRLVGTAAVTPSFAGAAVREIERIAQEDRFVQIMLPARSMEPYGAQRYWPIWEAAAAHDLVIALTYGGGAGTPPTPVNWLGSFFESYVAAPINFATQIASLVVSGVFAQWPTLRVTVTESGWTWLPAVMWRLDAEWRQLSREVPWLTEAPSAYVRRHFRFTTQPSDLPAGADDAARVLARLGTVELAPERLLLYGSDYPHTYESDGGADRLFDLLSPAARENVLAENARRWYRLPEPADRVRINQTSGKID